MKTDDSPHDMLTVAATAERFSISRRQLYRMLNDGRIKAKKQGRSTKIIVASALAMIDGLPDYGPTR